jgi:hypothetical protein
MSSYSIAWQSFYNKLSRAKKNLSKLQRGMQILAQSNCHLLKENTAWVKSYHNLAGCHHELRTSYDLLLEASKEKDKALKYSEQKNFHLIQENSHLIQEKAALRDKIFELHSLVTPFFCDGISAEDYLNRRE